MSTDFKFDLEGGFMRYNHPRDRWVVWSTKHGRLTDIDANHYGTIREFKAWAQEQIDEREKADV